MQTHCIDVLPYGKHAKPLDPAPLCPHPHIAPLHPPQPFTTPVSLHTSYFPHIHSSLLLRTHTLSVATHTHSCMYTPKGICTAAPRLSSVTGELQLFQVLQQLLEELRPLGNLTPLAVKGPGHIAGSAGAGPLHLGEEQRQPEHETPLHTKSSCAVPGFNCPAPLSMTGPRASWCCLSMELAGLQAPVTP